MAKAYRFHGVVALNTEAGTVYLPAPDATKLAQSLAKAARSIATGESFGQSDCNGPDVADFSHTADAHNIGDAIAGGLVRVNQIAPNQWHGRFRKSKAARFRSVCNGAGLPIVYMSPRAAYAAACYSL